MQPREVETRPHVVGVLADPGLEGRDFRAVLGGRRRGGGAAFHGRVPGDGAAGGARLRRLRDEEEQESQRRRRADAPEEPGQGGSTRRSHRFRRLPLLPLRRARRRQRVQGEHRPRGLELEKESLVPMLRGRALDAGVLQLTELVHESVEPGQQVAAFERVFRPRGRRRGRPAQDAPEDESADHEAGGQEGHRGAPLDLAHQSFPGRTPPGQPYASSRTRKTAFASAGSSGSGSGTTSTAGPVAATAAGVSDVSALAPRSTQETTPRPSRRPSPGAIHTSQFTPRSGGWRRTNSPYDASK